MALPDIYNPEVVEGVIARIQKLSADTPPQWGKMNAAQMLAHCNVAYEISLEQRSPRPGALVRFLLRLLIKPSVVSEKPYKPHSRTAPVFLITEERLFEVEKNRLMTYLRKVAQMGPAEFEGRPSPSFGPLTSQEYNNMYYKHLDHHLRQFGV